MGKRHRSDLGELSESISTQLRVAEVEHKLLLQLHLNVRHHGVAASCHGGRQRQGLGGGVGGVQGRSKIPVSKRRRKQRRPSLPDSAFYLKTHMPFSPCSYNVKINASLYLPFPFGLVSLITYHFLSFCMFWIWNALYTAFLNNMVF